MSKKPITAQRNYKFDLSHEGVVCLCCGKILISYDRHDYRTCGCPQDTMIDGGQIDYVRYGGYDMDLFRPVLITPIFYTKKGVISKKLIKTYRSVYSKK